MSYSTKYYALVRDDNENVFTLNINKRDYVGSSTQITEYEENPLWLHYRGGRQDFENGKTIFPSSVSFTFFSNSGDDYSDIFDSSYKDYLLEIVHTKDSVSTTFWKGWINPANLTKRFLVDKYFITIEASDGLLDLKDIDFPVASASGHTKIINIVKAALDQTGIELDITDQLNITESHISGSVMQNISANTNRFIDTENGMVRYLNCYDTLERLLKSFNCKLALVEGKWTITAMNERQSDKRTYAHDTLTASTASNFNRIIDIAGYSPYFDSDQASKIAPIRKHNITFQNRNISDSVIFNGKFTEGISGWVNDSFHSLNVFNSELYAVTNQPSMPSIDATRSFDSIEFALSQITTGDTLTVSVDARIESISFSGAGVAYPTIQITLHYPDSSTESTPASLGTMRLTDGYKTYSHTFDVDQNGDYYVTISVVPAEPTQLYAEIRLDNILGIPTFSEDSEVTFDRYYEIIDTDSNAVQVTETTTYFADSGHVSDLGAFKYSSTELTSLWNSHDGSVTDVPLMELLGYLKLQQRNRFIDYVRLSIVADKTINFNSILKINEKYYDIISFNHGLRFNQLNLELAEHLDTSLETGYTFSQYILNTVDGKSSGGGSTGSVTVGQFQDFVSDTNDTLNAHAVEISALETYNLQDITQNSNSTNEGIVLKNTGNTKSFRLSIDESTGHLLISGGSNQNIHVSGDVIAYSSSLPPSTDWWENAPLGTGLVYSGGTINVTGGGGSIGAIGTINSVTKSANGAVITGTTLFMQTADATYPGLVSTGTQTFAGDKTLSGILRFPNASSEQRKLVLYESGDNNYQYYGFGIGAATLQYKLGSTTADHVWYAAADSTTANELMRVKGNGNVGIGINPTHKFHIDSTAVFNTSYQVDIANGSDHLSIGANSTGSEIQSFASKPLYINPLGNNVLINTGSGNVGIGETSPDYKLVIKDGTGGAQLKFKRGTGVVQFIQDNNANKFYIRATQNLILNDTGGNVGIGTASPSSLAPSRVGLSIDSADNGGFLDIRRNGSTAIRFITDSTLASFIQSTNDLKIQVNSIESTLIRSTGLLQASGQGRFKGWNQTEGTGLALEVGISSSEGYVYAYDRTASAYYPVRIGNGTNYLRITSTGNFFNGNVTATGEVTAYSDRRLKDKIENYNKGLDSILAIQPVLYNMKGNAKQHIGVIAQDMQQVERLLVENSNDILSVNYQKISVMLINAVKELKQQNDELRERIQVLEANNNAKKTRNKKS